MKQLKILNRMRINAKYDVSNNKNNVITNIGLLPDKYYYPSFNRYAIPETLDIMFDEYMYKENNILRFFCVDNPSLNKMYKSSNCYIRFNSNINEQELINNMELLDLYGDIVLVNEMVSNSIISINTIKISFLPVIILFILLAFTSLINIAAMTMKAGKNNIKIIIAEGGRYRNIFLIYFYYFIILFFFSLLFYIMLGVFIINPLTHEGTLMSNKYIMIFIPLMNLIGIVIIATTFSRYYINKYTIKNDKEILNEE